MGVSDNDVCAGYVILVCCTHLHLASVSCRNISRGPGQDMHIMSREMILVVSEARYMTQGGIVTTWWSNVYLPPDPDAQIAHRSHRIDHRA